MIGLLNYSSVCTDAELQAIASACDVQIHRDCAPAWNMAPVPVRFVHQHPQGVPGYWPIYVLDDADQQGVLGWHQWDGWGVPYGRVFAKTCKQYGVEVSTVVSHEVVEPFVNPHVDRWRRGYAVEVGDPVEDDYYPINGVNVSNFAFPAWWTPGSAGPWDFQRKSSGPFKLTRGGYAITSRGTVWGEDVPEWRKLVKITDGSRTLRMAPESDLAALGMAA